ncbi:ras-related protein Rab-1B-like [Biomphalaria glabrata]|uniref:Ras-related protein Rab-1B-like n=1 Tax=Biomphalaria glabrata TaxID=6526 RepID=A0A9W3AYX8_BIOGL|nr:ras-related protein Rab-1B-like [Biomphalaria glabrata]XP_055892425.1 ras-related protein Rab-1B-like [Biomphalaria glabrata]
MSSNTGFGSCRRFKVVLIGDSGVGKTALFLRLRDGIFCDTVSTIGVDSFTRNIVVDGLSVKLTLVDTAGIERFNTLSTSYYRHSHAVFFVYSVDKPASLASVRTWNKTVDIIAPNVVRFLVGTKNDIQCGLCQTTVEHVANSIGCKAVFDTSAKTGHGVSNLLEIVCKCLITEQNQEQQEETNSKFNLDDLEFHSKTNQSACCS